MMKINKIISMLLTLALLVASLAIPAMAEDNIKVLLNGTELTFDVPPQLIDDRTMVPMRKIFEALGAKVEWDAENEMISAYPNDGGKIVMQIGNKVIAVGVADENQQHITFDVAPIIVDGRTLVPVRAVSECMGADVDWNDGTQTVTITKAEKAVVTNAPTATAKSARYPEEGELYGYGNDGIAELQYNARYLFEQRKVPSTVFEYEKETIEYINTSNIIKMKENILGMWELAAADVVLNDLELSGGKVPATEDLIWELVDEKRPEFGLGDEHIVDVSIEKFDSDTNAIIVKLLDTKWTMLSTYIGIAYNKTTGLKVFTLERSYDALGDGNIPYMFCYVEDGSRGSYHTISNDKQAFINAIKGVMSNSPTPSVSSEGIAVIDGVKCVLDVTIYIMDIAPLDEGVLSRAVVSVYNDKGENINSKLNFSKIQLIKGKETKDGTVDSSKYEYGFMSNWEVGQTVDNVTVEIKDSKGNIVKMSTKNVKVKGLADSLQDLLGPGVKVEIN